MGNVIDLESIQTSKNPDFEIDGVPYYSDEKPRFRCRICGELYDAVHHKSTTQNPNSETPCPHCGGMGLHYFEGEWLRYLGYGASSIKGCKTYKYTPIEELND